MAITYRDAGVDIDAGDELVERIKPLASRTRIPEVLADVGGFAGLCSLPSGIVDPVLVSGTDGVGTKLKVAFATGQHTTIGQDLVAMCVNDVVTCGARPLFFLDYFACGHLDVDVAEQVIAGIADGCHLAGCALLGGETAELPGMYPKGEYDLAGFAVGVVSKHKILGPARVRVTDAVIGIASTGLHSNGYSLARWVIEQRLALRLDTYHADLGCTVAEALLRPTRIYARSVAALAESLGDDLHALCHVTGGGVPGNLPRVLPDGTKAVVRLPEPPAVFRFLEQGGPVSPEEMARTFNLGVGLVAVVADQAAEKARAVLAPFGDPTFLLGEVAAQEPGIEPVVEFR